MASLGIEAADLVARAEGLRADGQTVMFVAVDGKPAGLVGVADPSKESTPEAISTLHDGGIRIVMMTGDSAATAKAVAKKLGFDDALALAQVGIAMGTGTDVAMESASVTLVKGDLRDGGRHELQLCLRDWQCAPPPARGRLKGPPPPGARSTTRSINGC